MSDRTSAVSSAFISLFFQLFQLVQVFCSEADFTSFIIFLQVCDFRCSRDQQNIFTGAQKPRKRRIIRAKALEKG